MMSHRGGDRMSRAKHWVAAVAGAAWALQAAGTPAASLDREQYVMGTRLHLHLRGPDATTLERASERAFREVARLDRVLSSWDAASELTDLNELAVADAASVSAELYGALAAATRVAAATGGAFDPTVEPLIRAYDLRGTPHVPPATALRRALAPVGHGNLELHPAGRTVAFTHPDVAVNLGGIGKGIALDRVAELLRAEGVDAALVNFGGQILALGGPAPGQPWTLEIADPGRRDRPAARLEVRDASVATSSQSTQTFATTGGGAIGHILDPRTGRPAPAWGGATVVAASATEADALSTALFVMGPEAARRFVAARDDAAAILIEPSAPAPRLTLAGHAPGLLAVLPPRDDTAGDRTSRAAPPARAGGDRTGGGQAAGGDQEPPPSNTELARRIDIVAAEVEAMKLGEVAGEPAPTYGFGPAASKVYHVPGGVSVGGYGEMLYENFAGEREDDTPSGKTDRLDFLRAVTYIGYKFTDSIVFNSEIEFEHASTGRSGSASVEFAYVDFLASAEFGARAGLLLVPAGFVNELHEPPIFLGARRPDVEQKIIPSTWRAGGAGIFGQTDAGLSYRGYIVEGFDGAGFNDSQPVRGGRQKGSKAKVEDVAFAGRLDLERQGLLVGASVYTGGSAQGATVAIDTLGNTEAFTARTILFEAHGQYRGHGLQARALYAHLSIDEAEKLNRATGRASTKSIPERAVGWYVEAGYDILAVAAAGSGMQLIPFVRFEDFDTQDRVPAGFAADPKNDRQVTTIGASFHPHPQVAIKGDLQIRSNAATTGVNQFNLALGFLF